MAYICAMCDNREMDCKCERYCTLCKSDSNVRLCDDGCYYCGDCREICGYMAEESYTIG